MFRFLTGKSKKNPSLDCEPDGDRCRQILKEQLGYIAKTCDIAASGTYSVGNKPSVAGDGGTSYHIHRHATLDADELFVHVVDHLEADDYRCIRKFKGQSSITTYITAIISRLVVDIVRQRTGRNRAKERAECHGELGRHVYDLMVMNGHTADETSDILLSNFNIHCSADELMEIHSNLLGRNVRHQSCCDTETAWGADGELVVIQRQNPEMELMSHAQNDRRRYVLAGMIKGLNGEERLLLRLRYPLDDETAPLDMEQIAKITGQTPRQADSKLRRILQSCREGLLKKGLRLDDLL
jgi:RNA polymerase sigma factor (sigma-70 family)